MTVNILLMSVGAPIVKKTSELEKETDLVRIEQQFVVILFSPSQE